MDRRVQTVLPCIREFAFWFKSVSEHAGSLSIGGETHAVVRPWSDPSILLICDIVWARRAVQPSWVGCVPADAMWQSLSPARQLEMIASMMRKTRITAKRHCNGTSVIQWFFSFLMIVIAIPAYAITCSRLTITGMSQIDCASTMQNRV